MNSNTLKANGEPWGAVDGRMLSEKTLEPLTLPLPCRQFLESVRAGQLSEAFLNLALIHAAEDAGDCAAARGSSFSMLAFANALSSPDRERGCEFLTSHGFEIAPHKDTLLDYFLLSSLDLRSSSHHESASWLISQGARVRPERRLCWRALEQYYPRLFTQNQAFIERAELDELLPEGLAEVREAPRL